MEGWRERVKVSPPDYPLRMPLTSPQNDGLALFSFTSVSLFSIDISGDISAMLVFEVEVMDIHSPLRPVRVCTNKERVI